MIGVAPGSGTARTNAQGTITLHGIARAGQPRGASGQPPGATRGRPFARDGGAASGGDPAADGHAAAG